MLNKKVKTFLSLVIAFVMVLGNISPISVLAETNGLDVENVIDTEAYETTTSSVIGIDKNTTTSSAIEIDETVEDATGTLDLTQTGTIDWVHLADKVDRKKINEPVIKFERLGEAAETQMKDSPIKFSWTDGAPTEEAQDITTGKVFNSISKVVGPTPSEKEEGYKITILPNNSQRQLIFTTGAWNAKGNLSIAVDGTIEKNYPIDVKRPAISKKYTIEILPGKAYEVKCLYVEKYHKSGNVNLTSIALKEKEIIGGITKESLNSLIKDIESVEIVGYTDSSKSNFDAALARAKESNSNPDASENDISDAYAKLITSVRNLKCSGKYTDETADKKLLSSFGCAEDKDAPIAYIDGSYKLRDRGNLMIRFGVTDINTKMKWYNELDYLPCFVSEYNNDKFDVKIKNFADKLTLEGNDYEVAYSRYSVTNKTEKPQLLPVVSPELVPINEAAKNKLIINPEETIVRDYAVASDRFGNSYSWSDDSLIAQAGGWDQHFTNMQQYWEDKLKNIALIEKLPNKKLIDSYKAGYIYTYIINDGKNVHVGENYYDRVFDHDTIGIVSTLFTLGDFTNAKAFLNTLPAQLQFDDAKWKYSWPFALYLRRTSDLDYIRNSFDRIKENTHKIETDRLDNGKGIMKKTRAIDSWGYWTIDNWSALTGLLSYKYICEQLGETEEIKWAEAQYNDLLNVVNTTLADTMKKYSLNYIPVSMLEPNDFNRCADARDANWASMFLFGRWAWDGYLFNGHQEGVSFEMIDDTYTYGFDRLEDILEPYNFGGYPHGIYSSAYNAGYGSAALVGEKYRDAGIKAYEFMIDKSMSGPFGWWEGIAYPNESSLWDIPHSPGGGGSCQHMWGQSVNTKILFDSLIAEKIDGNLIIGRGVPDEWLAKGEEIKISNYAIGNNKRIGFDLVSKGKSIELTMAGNVPENDISLELPFLRNNIESTTCGTIDNEKGIVKISKDTRKVIVTLKNEVVITDTVKIEAPRLNEAEQEGNKIKLSWNEVKNAEAYVIRYGNTDDKLSKIVVTDGNSCLINTDKFYPDVNYKCNVYAYCGKNKSDVSNNVNFTVFLPESTEGGSIEASLKAPADEVNLTNEGGLDWIRVGGAQNINRVERKNNTDKYIAVDNLQQYNLGLFNDSKVNYTWRDGTIEPTCDSSKYGLVFSAQGGNIDASGDGWIIAVPADTKERILRIYTSCWKGEATLTSYLSDNSAEIKSDSFGNQKGSTYKVYEIKYHAKNDGEILYVKSHTDKKYSGNGNHTLMAATLEGEVPTPIIDVSSVTLDRATAKMTVGEQITLNAKVEPENATNKDVTWRTSDKNVATVENGIVKAVGKGKTTITVAVGKVSATCEITVEDTAANPGDNSGNSSNNSSSNSSSNSSNNNSRNKSECDTTIESTAIILNKATAKMITGEEIILNAKVEPENATNKNVTWSTSDKNVAIVKNGVVKAVGKGKATITVAVGNVNATCEIIVEDTVNKTVNNSSVDNSTDKSSNNARSNSVREPEDNTRSNSVREPKDNTRSDSVGKIGSNARSSSVEKLESNTGGNSVENSENNYENNSADDSESDSIIEATAIVLNKTAAKMAMGEEITLNAKVEPENATNKDVTWRTSDKNVATVENGIVKAVGKGKATITATVGNASIVCDIIVEEPINSATNEINLDTKSGDMVRNILMLLLGISLVSGICVWKFRKRKVR